jgi:hypothetical protein
MRVLGIAVKLTRVKDSNLCHIDQDVVAGVGGTVRNVGGGLTWAGLIQLNIITRFSSASLGINTFRVTRLDKLVGQPFPLVAGNQFAISVTADNVDSNGVTMSYTFEQSCKVGATGPASTLVPAMAGKQTELKCSLTFDTGGRPQQSVLHWFSAVGCFAHDPSKP